MSSNAELSKLLWDAREYASMLVDIVERRTGNPDDAGRLLVERIDEYRACRGWPMSGFGDECEFKAEERIEGLRAIEAEWTTRTGDEYNATLARGAVSAFDTALAIIREEKKCQTI